MRPLLKSICESTCACMTSCLLLLHSLMFSLLIFQHLANPLYITFHHSCCVVFQAASLVSGGAAIPAQFILLSAYIELASGKCSLQTTVWTFSGILLQWNPSKAASIGTREFGCCIGHNNAAIIEG